MLICNSLRLWRMTIPYWNTAHSETSFLFFMNENMDMNNFIYDKTQLLNIYATILINGIALVEISESNLCMHL